MAFASGWGTTGFCLFWENNNNNNKQTGKPLVAVTARAGKALNFSSLTGSWVLQRNALPAEENRGSAPAAARAPAAPKPWPDPARASTVPAPAAAWIFSRLVLPGGNPSQNSGRSSWRSLYFFGLVCGGGQGSGRGKGLRSRGGVFFFFFLQCWLFRGVSCVINAEWLR